MMDGREALRRRRKREPLEQPEVRQALADLGKVLPTFASLFEGANPESVARDHFDQLESAFADHERRRLWREAAEAELARFRALPMRRTDPMGFDDEWLMAGAEYLRHLADHLAYLAGGPAKQARRGGVRKLGALAADYLVRVLRREHEPEWSEGEVKALLEALSTLHDWPDSTSRIEEARRVVDRKPRSAQGPADVETERAGLQRVHVEGFDLLFTVYTRDDAGTLDAWGEHHVDAEVRNDGIANPVLEPLDSRTP